MNGAAPLAVVDTMNTASPVLDHVHADHLDRPVMMTNSTKAAVWEAQYRPFGEVSAVTGTATLNLRFPGEWYQLEAGLAYNWHRHYDATLGRYLQPDPLGFVDGPSVYAYAKSSPQMLADPDGRVVPVIVGAGAGLAALLTSSPANAPGPNSEILPADDWAPIVNGLVAGSCLTPHYWWSSRSGGGGIRLWRDGPGVDWHKFKLNKKWVNRPHIEPGGRTKHHWPWN